MTKKLPRHASVRERANPRVERGGVSRQPATVQATPKAAGQRYYGVALYDGETRRWALQSTHPGGTAVTTQTQAERDAMAEGKALAKTYRRVRVTWGSSHASMTRLLFQWTDGAVYE